MLNGVPLLLHFQNYPSPLEVMQNHGSVGGLFPKEIDTPAFKQARDIGFKAIKALGLKTAMTHIGWFRSDGTVAVGGCARPQRQISKVTGQSMNGSYLTGSFDG